VSALFADFWATYPKKLDKGHAVKAYRAALKKAEPEVILAAIKAQAPTMTAGDERFCPLAATWLNGERWLDELAESTGGTSGYFAPFTPGPPPHEIEDDQAAVEAWLEERRQEHYERQGR
jgi:hypothetical protein